MAALALTAVSPLTLTAVSPLAGPAVALAADATSGHATCEQAAHRYVEAVAARNHHGVTTVTAHPATFHCGGPDDGHYAVSTSSETLRLHAAAVVKVFHRANDPSAYQRVKPSALPRRLQRNSAEPIYRISGHRRHITRMTEQFHP
jgi:hypothetical protein